MRHILGKARTVRELLKGCQYSVDYYQRKHKWGEKHVRGLMDNLVGKVEEEYEPGMTRKKVTDLPHYFLRSAVLSRNVAGEYRNRLGGLLLLPKSFNASHGALPYEHELEHFTTQDLVAWSLHPHAESMTAALDEGGVLHGRLAGSMWNPASLLQEAGA